MAQVLVRNIADDLVERLKQRAERNQRSLEAELREILKAAARPDIEEFIRWSREMRSRQKPNQKPDSLTLLRRDRARGG